MTPEQIEMSIAIGKCTYLPASFEKRFARSMSYVAESNPAKELTERQDKWLREQFYRYRNQIAGHNTDKRIKNLLKAIPENPNQNVLQF